MDPILFILICLIIGALAGFLGGLFGLGGGVIVVPGLMFLLDLADIFPGTDYPSNTVALVAVATSMASIVFTTMASSISQIRRNAVDWLIVRDWILFLVFGVLLATWIASSLPALAIKLFIGLFIASIATLMVTTWEPDPNRKLPGKFGTGVIASFGGFICGLAGIGGGNVVVPTLLFFNTKVIQATAAASTLGIVISIAGTAGYVLNGWTEAIPSALGYVYLPALMPIALACILFAPLGVHVAHKTESQRLKRAFGFLMYVVAARMVYDAFFS